MNALYQLKNKQPSWINPVFYFACLLLGAVIFCYGIFFFKTYLQQQKIDELAMKIATYGTPEDKMAENKVIEYKKKIDDFALLLAGHKISLKMFNFIEEKTLPDVWFSSISASGTKNEVTLIGQAATGETLSRQMGVFEDSKEYVKNISLLSSQFGEKGSINFTVGMALEPKLFSYDPPLIDDSLEPQSAQ